MSEVRHSPLRHCKVTPTLHDLDKKSLQVCIEVPDITQEKTVKVSWHGLNCVVQSTALQLTGLSCGRITQTKPILKELSGSAVAGTVTAILGPSGSGKSTLLDCLFGKRRTGITGTISYSGFKSSRVALISQSDYLLEQLTVRETLIFASKMTCTSSASKCEAKLSAHPITHAEKAVDVITHNTTRIRNSSNANKPDVNSASVHSENVVKVLGQLSLVSCADVKVRQCSGGQKKRLSIACELISLPSILLLDEPTSGLDSSTCLQCIQLLKKLNESSHKFAIILSIHQPSARVLSLFDTIYVISKHGQNIYNGPASTLVSYLSDCNLLCPKYHNPSDFIIEIASGELGEEALQKVTLKARHINIQDCSSNQTAYRFITSEPKEESRAFLWHLRILLWRNLTVVLREPLLTSMRFFCNLIVGFVVSLLYGSQVGIASGCNSLNSFGQANVIRQEYMISTNENLTFLLFTLVFLTFTAMMPTVLTFPRELAVFLKEHGNGWYSCTAYYLAKVLIDLPFQFLFPITFIVVAYPLTGQHQTDSRFILFTLICCLMCLVAQSIGVLIGTLFPDSLNVVVFLAPISSIPAFLFSGFFVRINSMPSYLQPFAYLSYVKYALESLIIVIYGLKRCEPPDKLSLDDYNQDSIQVNESEHVLSPSELLNLNYVFKSEQYYGYKPIPFSYVLTEFGLEDKSISEGCLLLLTMAIILRLLSAIALWRQANAKI